nr:ribosomal protein S16 [Coccidia sp. AB-2023a]
MKKIKLLLKGNKHNPFFKVGIIDSRLKTKKQSKLGYYSPKNYLLLLNYRSLLQTIKLGAFSTKNIKNLFIYQLKFNLKNFKLINI